MSLVLPASVPVEGTRRVIWIPGGVADQDAITLGEIASGTDVSCYITGNGWTPTGDQAVIPDPRLCSTQDLQRGGRKTKGLTIQYVWNEAEPTDDEAHLDLIEGTAGVLVNVLQKDEDEEEYLAGDPYQAWPVTLGEQWLLPPETNAIDRISQLCFVTGKVTVLSPIPVLVAGS
jgi:hypothetical protein